MRADEAPSNVQTGRAVFCAAFLVWAVVGFPAVFRHREQGNDTAAAGAALAAAFKVGVGLFVGGGSLLRWVTTKTPDAPTRTPRDGAAPVSPPPPGPGGD